jgi:uracil-DNA glycosylase
MNNIETLLLRGRAHPQWHEILTGSLAGVDPEYLADLIVENEWLPGADNLVGAFRRDLQGVRYLLIGESPYPRQQSANGIAFYDAAVGSLWSDGGLSKAVNRATSMRNIIKTMLLAEQRLAADSNGKVSQQAIAEIDNSDMIQTMAELFANLQQAGFLMINATPVLHPRRKPAQEAVYWRGFLEQLLISLAARSPRRITLLLWGKIAESLQAIPASAAYEKLICEHPYNISFIDNADMRRLFSRLRILQRVAGA